MGRKLKKREKHTKAFESIDHRASAAVRPAQQTYAVAAVCGILLVAVVVVFGQTAGHDFVNFDDNQYVYENRHVRGGLTIDGIAWAATAFYASNWHPLTWLSHMLDCQLYGLWPRGHHLMNVLLHAAAAILLFLSLRRMTGALWPSAWVAAIFAIHPLRVESVAWVAERKDVLSGLFFMLTLWFYARYVERPSSWGRYLLVVASFVLGLTAKPMLVTLPFVLLLLDYWPLGRLGSPADPLPFGERLGRLVIEKLPLFVLAAFSCAVTLAAQHDAIRPLEQVAISARLAYAAMAYVGYLGKMFYPSSLAVLYPLPNEPPSVGEMVGAVAVLLAISASVFSVRRKCPYLLFGWLWYLGTLAPVIGLVQVGNQAMADRYTYLTQIGLYVALAWGAADLAGTRLYRRRAFAAVSALVVMALIGCAWMQARHWRNSETLWAHTLTSTSQNASAHNGRGCALAKRGQIEEAIAHYRQAIEIKPDYADAHNNLGLALAGRGQFEEAIAHYRTAIQIQPKFAEAHVNLGVALADCGQVDQAISLYRQALEIRPDYAEAHNNLGNGLTNRGQFEEAIAHYRQALEIQPDLLEARNNLSAAYNNLGAILAGQGKVDEAIADYRMALEIKHDYVNAHINLGLALAGRGQVVEAISQYRQALEFQPDRVEAHINLGAALADYGQVDEAIAHYQRAIEIKPDSALSECNLGNALAARGNLVAALEHYRKAVELADSQNNRQLADVIRAKMKLAGKE